MDQSAPSPGNDNRERRAGTRPSRWAAVALGAVALATVTLRLPLAVVIALCAVGAGCVGTDAVLAFRARVRATRGSFPTLARQVPHRYIAEVDVEGARVSRLRQPAPPELVIDPPEAGTGTIDGTLTGRHRGTHLLPPPVVRVSGPLGLATSDHTVGGTDLLTVLPDLPRARRLALLRRTGRTTTEEGRVRNRLGLGTEFESIREYAPDDDIRQVNWLATARIGRPMTNLYRIDDNRDLLCLVDCGRLMASPVAGGTRLDVALDALAVLAVAADDAGDRVGTVAFSGGILRELPPRRRGAEQVVRTLFDLEPMEVESDYERAFQSVSGRKRSLVALYTDLVDPAAARTLLSVMPLITRRHVVMIVSCRDDELQQTLTSPPSDVRDVLRAAVSLDLLDARRRTFALLRRMGTVVVESEPLSLGPACVDAYTRIKSSGRL